MVDMVSSKNPPRELISFYVGEQHFCIDIMVVREIRGWTTATPLPHAPAASRGVVNLRGTMLPIIDLAAQLGLPSAEATKQSVIIVVEVHGQMVGLLVDGVNGILTVTAEMIQEAPPIALNAGMNQVQGMVEVEGHLQTLLCLDGVIPDLVGLAA